MDDITSPTDDTSLVTTPASDAPAASTPGSEIGGGPLAAAATDQATAATELQTTDDPIGTVLAGIPADDADLQAIADAQQRELLTGLRGQLRTLGTAVRELQPLRPFAEFGDPKAVAPRLQIAKLLYSPLMRNGQPVVDQRTRTPYVTTAPLWEHLDKVSPGMPEQALVDLVHFQPTGEDGNKEEPLGHQYLRILKLDPARLSEYQNIDAQIARTSGTITPEELAEIPAEYHAAYRTIPPSIRAAWKSYDEADQTRMLEAYKHNLDTANREEERKKADEIAKARSDAEYAQQVAVRQGEYFQTIREERFNTLYSKLSEQIVYSTDPVTNEVNLGTLCSTLALMLDPQWRFIPVNRVLKPLGIQLDSKFDAILNKFDTNAMAKVAYEMAGDSGQAVSAEADAVAAADQLMAKIAPWALSIAMKQGATQTEKAKQQAAALARATAARPTAGTGQPGTYDGKLPPGIQPGTREAVEHTARQTGFFVETPA